MVQPNPTGLADILKKQEKARYERFVPEGRFIDSGYESAYNFGPSRG
jgi:hypothetical protein